jgi:hypothetical protein
MKKILSVFFAFAMMLSIVFIGEATSSNGSLSVQAQTGTVTVRRKRRGGIVGGVKYIGRKTYGAGKYVAHKTVRGTVYAGKKTVQGTRYTAHKTKRGAKAVTSRTKKIILGN